MEVLATVLPIVIDILLIVLLTVFIIVGIKLIGVMNKAQKLINNVEEKVNTFNAFFGFINVINSKFAGISEKVASLVEAIVTKLTRKKKKVKEPEDEYDYEEEDK